MQSAVEFEVSSTLYRVICLCMFNGKMNFSPHENEVMEEEINYQHEEMSDQEMSDEDHALSDDSNFGSDMENSADTIEVIYRDLNQAQVNILYFMKKMCCTEFYYTDSYGNYCSSCIVRIYDQFSRLPAFKDMIPTYV